PTSAGASAVRTTPPCCTRSTRSTPSSSRTRNSGARSTTSSTRSASREPRRPRRSPGTPRPVHGRPPTYPHDPPARALARGRPGRPGSRLSPAPTTTTTTALSLSGGLLRPMDFQVAREPWLRALQLLQNIVEPRQTLPILANVLIEARPEGLRLAATDLEVGARVAVPGTVTRPGAITLAARKLVELVRELPTQPVAFSLLDNGWVKVTCGGARFSLVGLPAEEYPPLDVDGAAGSLAVEAGLLRTMVGRTSYAMSQDESRPFLNGLYLNARKHEFRLVATDGHRLALACFKDTAATE